MTHYHDEIVSFINDQPMSSRNMIRCLVNLIGNNAFMGFVEPILGMQNMAIVNLDSPTNRVLFYDMNRLYFKGWIDDQARLDNKTPQLWLLNLDYPIFGIEVSISAINQVFINNNLRHAERAVFIDTLVCHMVKTTTESFNRWQQNQVTPAPPLNPSKDNSAMPVPNPSKYLNKFEYFTSEILQGLISGGNVSIIASSKQAISLAKQLTEALEGNKTLPYHKEPVAASSNSDRYYRFFMAAALGHIASGNAAEAIICNWSKDNANKLIELLDSDTDKIHTMYEYEFDISTKERCVLQVFKAALSSGNHTFHKELISKSLAQAEKFLTNR